jgi:imidazolonepropionase-like amidohydrolase
MESMRRRTFAFAIAFVVLVSALALSRVHSVVASDDDESITALFAAKIYSSPTEPAITDGAIIIRDGKIAAVGKRSDVVIPAHAKDLNFPGSTITAGFQNSHVHFTEPKWVGAEKIPSKELHKQLDDMLLRYGFTTVVDTGSFLSNTNAIRKRIESGEIAGPRILTAGGPLYPPDGIPYYLHDLPPEILKLLSQPSTPAAAVAVVDDDLAGGADIIKLFTGSWIARGKVKPMPVDVASAAVEEAHKHNKLVFTHPSNVAGLQVALAAHVDVLAHSIEDMRGWDNSYLAQMKTAKMSLIPTLKLFGEDDDVQKILDEVGSYQRMGGQVLFGTDVGYLTDYDPTKEYELMARAGLTPMQILASLTTVPAERFGESDKRGRIAVGMDADLVVLSRDPAQGANNFAKVCETFRAGQGIGGFGGVGVEAGGRGAILCIPENGDLHTIQPARALTVSVAN